MKCLRPVFFLPLSLFSFADCRVYSVCSRCQTSVDTRSAFQPPTHIRQAGLDYRRQGAIFDSDSSLAWKSGTRSVQTLLPLDTGVLGCRARWGWGRKGWRAWPRRVTQTLRFLHLFTSPGWLVRLPQQLMEVSTLRAQADRNQQTL